MLSDLLDPSGVEVSPTLYRSIIESLLYLTASRPDIAFSVGGLCSKSSYSTTAKVEYIAAGSCCIQLLWMKKLLHDYGIPQNTMCVFCDNTSAINFSKNLVQHSKSKHIEIHYHFIQDLVEDKVVCLEFIHTDNQKVDIFTKPLDGPWFESLR